ncbi:MAG: hypothetical protein NWR12_10970, partial [Haliea sp.]|nr:hypothetical protein [Haliea sp.]
LRVTDQHARLLAEADAPASPLAAGAKETFWLLQALYRRALAEEKLEPRGVPDSVGYLHADEVDAALSGRSAQQWYGTDSPGRRLLAAAAPIYSRGNVIGTVVVLIADRSRFQPLIGLQRLGPGIGSIRPVGICQPAVLAYTPLEPCRRAGAGQSGYGADSLPA